VRRLHRELESRTDACACSNACTASDACDTSAYASAGAASVLLWLWLHRQLCYDGVVRRERECLLRLWWGVVRISPGSRTGSHNSGSHKSLSFADAAGAEPSSGVLCLQEPLLGFLR